ncbi:hypothetical protein ABZZ20_24225 [Streptomyces sp. NPDC006430]|uniref:hypothetical protein n=1 Tax=Streptomyces sp. NPDC006430 TaxID=3154299 RepID=UPI0033BCAF46
MAGPGEGAPPEAAGVAAEVHPVRSVSRGEFKRAHEVRGVEGFSCGDYAHLADPAVGDLRGRSTTTGAVCGPQVPGWAADCGARS